MPPGRAGADALVKLLLEGRREASARPTRSVDSVGVGLTVEEFQYALARLRCLRPVEEFSPFSTDQPIRSESSVGSRPPGDSGLRNTNCLTVCGHRTTSSLIVPPSTKDVELLVLTESRKLERDVTWLGTQI